MRTRGVATLRLGLRVVIGLRQKSNVPGLQLLARHAHQVLAQPGSSHAAGLRPFAWIIGYMGK
jgi:hypothetical protein